MQRHSGPNTFGAKYKYLRGFGADWNSRQSGLLSGGCPRRRPRYLAGQIFGRPRHFRATHLLASGDLLVLESTAKLYPPVPTPRAEPLGSIALLRVLLRNPLEAWTQAHFEKPIVMSGLSIGRVAVVSDPAAIRRVLLDNCNNYKKDWLQRRVLSAGLLDGLLAAENGQWRTQRRALAPMFTPRSIAKFAAPMVEAADALAGRLRAQEGQVVDVAVEVTRVTLDVLERTIFSDGFGRDAEDIRKGMK